MALTTEETHVIAQSSDCDFVPFEHPEAGGTGGTVSFGEIAVLREQSHDGNVFITCFWRAEPATSPLQDGSFGDESGYIIRGTATVHVIDTGERLTLSPGDLYSFKKGTLTQWTIHEPFEKFAVIADFPSV